MTFGVALVLALSGCAGHGPTALEQAGWTDVKVADRDEVGRFLQDAATALEGASFRASIRTPEGVVDVTRHAKITRLRFDAEREGKTVPLELFQYDTGETLYFPRSIVCGADPAGHEHCEDVTLNLLGTDLFTYGTLPDSFYGIDFHQIFSPTQPQVSAPARWRLLASLAYTPLDLYRSVNGQTERIGLAERVYVTGNITTKAGEARCVGWYDSIDDVRNSRPRGGWCQSGGVWFADTGTTRLISLQRGSNPLTFPAPVELPVLDARLAPDAERLFHKLYPEYPAGFLETLLVAPSLR